MKYQNHASKHYESAKLTSLLLFFIAPSSFLFLNILAFSNTGSNYIYFVIYS